jgi:hypothetical protein
MLEKQHKQKNGQSEAVDSGLSGPSRKLECQNSNNFHFGNSGPQPPKLYNMLHNWYTIQRKYIRTRGHKNARPSAALIACTAVCVCV